MPARAVILIPAYNEEASIGDVIASLRVHCPRCDIVVINDGSRDNTAAIVRAAGATLLDLPLNLGIGGAMQTGFKYALRQGYPVAVQCDGDGQHPAEELLHLVERVEAGAADVVIGSRYVADTGYVAPLARRVGKSLLSRWIDALIGGGITDTTSGFRALNRRALALFCEHYPEDYPEPEALVLLHRRGLRVAEVPVHMRERQGGHSSIRPLGALYYMVKVALAVAIDRLRPKEYRH
jgi:glycosyltransferase involved in cell wall biosynthesis